MSYQQAGCDFSASFASDVSAGASLAERSRVGQTAAKLLAERRSRSSYFPSRLFADPAWDLLLVLALAETQHHRLSTSRLCDRLDVPATTVLRWINILADEGLLTRRDDVNDKRRKYIELSPQASAMMVAYCTATDVSPSLAV